MMSKCISTLAFLALLCFHFSFAEDVPNRWTIESDGSVCWNIADRLPHSDHIEMSGDSIASILYYEVTTDQKFQLSRLLVWPMLRTVPNNTHASFMRVFNDNFLTKVNVNGLPMKGTSTRMIRLNGIMKVEGEENGMEITQLLFPSTTSPAYIEKYTLRNKNDHSVWVEVPHFRLVQFSDPEKGVKGSYQITCNSFGEQALTMAPGDSISFGLVYSAREKGTAMLSLDADKELLARSSLLNSWWSNLILETPDTVLNREFAFAKIRASESIYKTLNGYLHSPGGRSYYAAIWANDQAEYVGPFFPYLGYRKGVEASLNAYLQFARFMNPEYNPIPSSVIAEGLDIWNGAGDRGDAAMIAYGAARFALAQGDRQMAEKLWPLIEWCLEYNHRKLNNNGVVTSETDELEGRFPAGDANLCTSSLYYDALLSAASLGKNLNKSSALLKKYKQQAAALKKAINSFFGATVEGFDTYRYYDGNDVLRAWICMPLTVDINDRAEGTVQALFSPRLWTDDGLATRAGDKTFWDRSTLYALRGVFRAGYIHEALKFLRYYSSRRLLGEHVPYPVEAYPEGNQRHLSAESGLYCRIFTEGVFGIRPVGLHSFNLLPRLPKEWNQMALRRVNAFGTSFDIEIQRQGQNLDVKIISSDKIIEKRIKEGSSLNITL